jgi:hypothetical protein
MSALPDYVHMQLRNVLDIVLCIHALGHTSMTSVLAGYEHNTTNQEISSEAVAASEAYV